MYKFIGKNICISAHCISTYCISAHCISAHCKLLSPLRDSRLMNKNYSVECITSIAIRLPGFKKSVLF